MFTKILACSDGSESAIQAVQKAAELAKIHHAALTLLHVCPLPYVPDPFPGASALAGPLVEAYVTDMHNAVMKRTLPAVKEVGVSCEVRREVGTPAAVIARLANQKDYHLVVLGSRGVGLDKAEKLGSVCHSVIHDASCPVLIVR